MQFELQLQEAKIKLKAEHTKVKQVGNPQVQVETTKAVAQTYNHEIRWNIRWLASVLGTIFWNHRQTRYASYYKVEDYYVRKLSIYSRRVQQGGCYSEGQIW